MLVCKLNGVDPIDIRSHGLYTCENENQANRFSYFCFCIELISLEDLNLKPLDRRVDFEVDEGPSPLAMMEVRSFSRFFHSLSNLDKLVGHTYLTICLYFYLLSFAFTGSNNL
jgi:hypothetical protein